ncbi:DNA recombination protein RmuC [Pseudonocardia sp.]|uniref:DNA recombination protein RmuC n=1 Tax=Pseudonocardia sp. TaxID=60912 RepID=UPI002605B9EF|nr:DNA recombination protein RmuC [Pseudonocardia sp.]MCW2718401.1 RmuC-domain protein [Pseudonocardia sp.]MDT7615468.1 recombination protein RmuC [Pseudonocardiales bacterium]
MDTTALLIGLVVGLAIGAGVAWALVTARARATVADAARAASDASAMLRADAAGMRAERAGLLERLEDLGKAHDRAVERLRRAESEAAAAGAALRGEREAGAQREELLTRRDAELKQAFQALSADALAQNNAQFVALAEGRLKEATAALHAKADGDAAARATAIGKLLDPMASTLQRVEGQLRTVEMERESAYAGLREQVNAMRTSSDALRGETKSLVNALRAPQVRGRWGELQLERIVQLAGMVEHCDFSTQVVGQGEDGGVRPDMVVHLAGGKQVVVDAKVPFAAYLEAVESNDPDVHRERLAAHARQLRQHVDQLSAKSYWAVFEPSPEFVVLFVPGDPFLEAALQADPSLMEHAFATNVVIATPTTLIALLRTVAYSWRQEALARNAAEVHKLGKELHGRLATMGTHVAKLGRSLDGAVDSYNRTVSSLEARVLVTARKLTELHVSDAELPTPGQVERAPRTISAPELLASAADSLVALHEVGRPERDEGSEPGPPDSRATVNG